jgi:PAS domain S-box-containing protein
MNLTYVSPSVEQLLGEPPEVHMKKTLEEKVFAPDLDRVLKTYREELESEKNSDTDITRSRLIELRHYRADGSLFWLEMNIKFLRDERQNIAGFLGVSRDIDERKKAEIALKDKVNELERFNKAMVGRENKMIELKREVNHLLKESGRAEKYATPDKGGNED